MIKGEDLPLFGSVDAGDPQRLSYVVRDAAGAAINVAGATGRWVMRYWVGTIGAGYFDAEIIRKASPSGVVISNGAQGMVAVLIEPGDIPGDVSGLVYCELEITTPANQVHTRKHLLTVSRSALN